MKCSEGYYFKVLSNESHKIREFFFYSSQVEELLDDLDQMEDEDQYAYDNY